MRKIELSVVCSVEFRPNRQNSRQDNKTETNARPQVQVQINGANKTGQANIVSKRTCERPRQPRHCYRTAFQYPEWEHTQPLKSLGQLPEPFYGSLLCCWRQEESCPCRWWECTPYGWSLDQKRCQVYDNHHRPLTHHQRPCLRKEVRCRSLESGRQHAAAVKYTCMTRTWIGLGLVCLNNRKAVQLHNVKDKVAPNGQRTPVELPGPAKVRRILK